MKSKANSKGFTLAELLIVVAIIAILIAVAIPVFAGAMDKAKRTVEDASVRAVKGAAVAKLLSDPLSINYDIVSDEYADGWFVDAEIDENGAVISKIQITNSPYDLFKETYIEGIGKNVEGARVLSDYAVIYRYNSTSTHEMVMGVFLFLRPIDLREVSISD